MSAYVKGKGLGQEEARVHRIRITLTSKNVKNLEKGTCCAVVLTVLTPKIFPVSLPINIAVPPKCPYLFKW